jgi:DNA-binding XRE family transcriptional regulator
LQVVGHLTTTDPYGLTDETHAATLRDMRDRVVDGATLRQLRFAAKLTREELAGLTQMRPSTIKAIEIGKRQPADIPALRLAEALGCTLDDFSTPTEKGAAA